MAKNKIIREKNTPKSQFMLVKFGFLKDSNIVGYHVGHKKFKFTAESLQCTDFLLSVVQDD